jgi:hypothetical protein
MISVKAGFVKMNSEHPLTIYPALCITSFGCRNVEVGCDELNPETWNFQTRN